LASLTRGTQRSRCCARLNCMDNEQNDSGFANPEKSTLEFSGGFGGTLIRLLKSLPGSFLQTLANASFGGAGILIANGKAEQDFLGFAQGNLQNLR